MALRDNQLGYKLDAFGIARELERITLFKLFCFEYRGPESGKQCDFALPELLGRQ
jgi:hypothetical protein